MMDLDTSSLKALLFYAARSLLTQADGPQSTQIDVSVTNRRGALVRFSLRPSAWPAQATAARQLVTSAAPQESHQTLSRFFFSEEERAIVAAVGRQRLQAKQIGRASRLGYCTKLKALLANLVGRGVLRSSVDGYEVADLALLELLREGDG